MALESVEKQPGDVQDYDADFSAFLSDLSDAGASKTVTVPSGITLDSSSLITSTSRHQVAGIVNGVVKMWFSGGTSGATYKITARLTTTAGRTREYDFNVKVKDL